MINFFKTCVIINPESPQIEIEQVDANGFLSTQGIKYEKKLSGYMDDPLNTDHAWKEVELWHIHYTGPDCLSDKMQSQIRWRIVTEDIFTKLPVSQATLMQELTQTLHPAIL